MRNHIVNIFIVTMLLPPAVAGQAWQPLTLPSSNNIISASFISDEEGWLGFENATTLSTLYHTTDGGNTWSTVGVNGSQNGDSYVCFISALKGFVVVNDKAFKTNSGGTTWTQLSLPGTPYFKPYFFNESIGFISGKGEVFKTTDGGENWIAYPVEHPSIELWDMHFVNDSVGYASEYNGYHYTTHNGGESWEYADDDGLWDYFFAVYYHPSGYITYTGYEDFFGEFTSYITGGGYSSQDIGKLYDLKWFDGNRAYALGQSGWVVSTDNEGLVWNETKLTTYSLNQVDGYEDVFVFGDHGTAFKLPSYCVAASAFTVFVSEGDVEFTDLSTNATAWLWNFGDGTTSTEQSPSHTYSVPGTYTVCLTTGMDGCLSDSVCQQVTTCKPNISGSPQGTIDAAFGENGFAIMNTGLFTDVFTKVLVQPDGKVLCGGEDVLARFLTDGTPDPAFDEDGMLEEWFWGYHHFALTADGRIVVTSRDNSDFMMARYHSDGSVDSSFGIDGKVTTDISKVAEDDFVVSSLIQPDEKIVVLGYYDGSGSEIKAFVARFLENGELDESFAGDGILKLKLPGFYPAALALQSNGEIVVGGGTEAINFLITRLHSNGSTDKNFGDNGIVSFNFTPVPTYSGLAKLLIQPDGKIVAAGNSGSGFAIARFHEDGSPDLSFAEAGFTSLQVYGINDVPRSAVLQPDGKILMTGYLQKSPDYDEVVILRFNGDGSLDQSFGNSGMVTTMVNCDDSQGRDIALDGDYIYVGGGRHVFNYGESCLIRYLNGCPAPGGLEVVDILSSFVALNWNDVAGAVSYKLRYKISGSGTWQKTKAAVSQKKISGLMADAKYTVQVGTECTASSNVSEWSEKLQFTTLPQKLESAPAEQFQLQVYPNPAASVVNINVVGEMDGTATILLKDMGGSEVKKRTIEYFGAGTGLFVLAIDDLAEGIYILQVQFGHSLFSNKLMVKK